MGWYLSGYWLKERKELLQQTLLQKHSIKWWQTESKNISKRSSTIVNWLHPRDIGMVQHLKIWQCNPSCKQTETKTQMIISLDTEKDFCKIQHLFMMKVLERSGIQWIYLNIIKAIFRKSKVNIKLKGEKLKATPLKAGTRWSYPLSSCLINIALKF